MRNSGIVRRPFLRSVAVGCVIVIGGCSSAKSPSDVAETTVIRTPSSVSEQVVDTFPLVTDPVVGFESNDGKRMIVAGAVRTEAERSELISASKLSFVGYEISDQLLVSDKALSIPDAQTMVDALSQVRAPVSFVYTGASYRLRGVVSNESAKIAVETALRASLGPITVPFSNELTVSP